MDSRHYRAPRSPDCNYEFHCGEISHEIPYGDSFGSRVLFAGRNVVAKGGDFWEKAHLIARQPFGLAGAALGGAIGTIGGAVYRAGMSALGRETRPLADYGVTPAFKAYKAFSLLGGAVLAPAVGALALGFSAVGVAGAALGATISTVVTPLYKMVMCHNGECAQTRRISDYIISAAESGAQAAMIAAAVAAFIAGMVLNPWIAVAVATGVLVSILASKYVISEPDWLKKGRNCSQKIFRA